MPHRTSPAIVSSTVPWEETQLRHRALVGLLELILRFCELPSDLAANAQLHYAEKTSHIKGCEWFRQFALQLTPQGSAATGTMVAPLLRKHSEFDVDLLLIVHIAQSLMITPSELHRRLGNRLRVNYANVLSALRLGWMLDYSRPDRFHFDVIPVVPCRHPSGIDMLAATDWKLAKWKFTNPQAFAAGYLKTGEKLPFIEDPEYRARLNEGTLVIANHSVRVDPLPEHTMMKNPLQRMTQLAKRFRDVWYSKRNALSRRTPSIVVTTLIWRAYEQHVAEKAFPSVFAVLHTLAENLTNPAVLKQTIKDGAKHYTLINPTVPDENLVARWNEPDHAGEADEFFSWATEFRKFIALLEKAEARYEIDRLLQDSLGGDSVTPVLKQLAEAMRSSRERVDLGFTPKLGITAAAAAGAVPLRGHTYHGK